MITEETEDGEGTAEGARLVLWIPTAGTRNTKGDTEAGATSGEGADLPKGRRGGEGGRMRIAMIASTVQGIVMRSGRKDTREITHRVLEDDGSGITFAIGLRIEIMKVELELEGVMEGTGVGGSWMEFILDWS